MCYYFHQNIFVFLGLFIDFEMFSKAGKPGLAAMKLS